MSQTCDPQTLSGELPPLREHSFSFSIHAQTGVNKVQQIMRPAGFPGARKIAFNKRRKKLAKTIRACLPKEVQNGSNKTKSVSSFLGFLTWLVPAWLPEGALWGKKMSTKPLKSYPWLCQLQHAGVVITSIMCSLELF